MSLKDRFEKFPWTSTAEGRSPSTAGALTRVTARSRPSEAWIRWRSSSTGISSPASPAASALTLASSMAGPGLAARRRQRGGGL